MRWAWFHGLEHPAVRGAPNDRTGARHERSPDASGLRVQALRADRGAAPHASGPRIADQRSGRDLADVAEDRSGRERRPTPRRKRQRTGPQPKTSAPPVITAVQAGASSTGRRPRVAETMHPVQRREQPEQRALAAAHQRRAASAANRWNASIRPAIDRARVMHGDLEREVEDHLAGDQHREDLRPGAPAGAQPGQRATEEDADGEQHRRVGQLTAAQHMAEGGELGGHERRTRRRGAAANGYSSVPPRPVRLPASSVIAP